MFFVSCVCVDDCGVVYVACFLWVFLLMRSCDIVGVWRVVILSDM